MEFETDIEFGNKKFYSNYIPKYTNNKTDTISLKKLKQLISEIEDNCKNDEIIIRFAKNYWDPSKMLIEYSDTYKIESDIEKDIRIKKSVNWYASRLKTEAIYYLIECIEKNLGVRIIYDKNNNI